VERQLDLPLNGPVYSADLVEGTDERQDPYLLVPSPEALQSVGPEGLAARLARLNIVVDEQIPLVKGFTAVMNQANRELAEKAGFEAIPNEEETFLHPEPWERKQQPSADGPAAPPAGPRQPLESPRFLTPLTQTYTGKGVGIAVIDTGIYPHPDMAYPHQRIVAFQDFVNGKSVPYDDNGHGTHVAGDAAGSGFLSGGIHRGTAPDANLIGIKVLDKNGRGSTSRILQGLNWAVENKARYNIRVINLSLGTGDTSARSANDPIRKAVERAVEEGIVVVVSAGNQGPETGTISSPGDSPAVITVGAVDDRNTPDHSDDRIPSFSSRGAAGSSKPDLVAPGEAIIGPNAPNSVLEATARKYTDVHRTLDWLQKMPDEELVNVPAPTLRMIGLNGNSIIRFHKSPGHARQELNHLLEATERLPMVETDYIGMPGTSMAAPIVAGVVAELLEANPHLTPAEVKDILRDSATPMPAYRSESQGAGMINPDRALSLALQRNKEPDDNGQLKLPLWG
ncbi:MAG: S8 family peptidase, partial [Candidatus Eremiobacteraeota bacterium]|nr:S8 family peptidase [Candidatus Eremiobacteraeota bacterium]